MLLFLYAPILVMIVLSFNEREVPGHLTGFTFRWYVELFSDPADLQRAVCNTIVIAVLAALLGYGPLGRLASVGIYALKRKPQALVLEYHLSAHRQPGDRHRYFANDPVSFHAAGAGILHYAALAYRFQHSLCDFLRIAPAAVRWISTPIRGGIGYWARRRSMRCARSFSPEIMPGVVTGALMAFTMSIDDFIISYFTSSGVQNLSIYVYSSAKRGIEPTVYALSTLMFVTVLTLLLILNRRSARERSAAKV